MEVMDVARHRSYAATATYQTTDTRSEGARLKTLGVTPTLVSPEKPRGEVEKPSSEEKPCAVENHQQPPAFEIVEEEAPSTGEPAEKLSFVPTEWPFSLTPIPSTQMELDDLETEVTEVRELGMRVDAVGRDVHARVSTAHPAQQSETRRQVRLLQREVQELRRQLERREAQLHNEAAYRQSLEHDHDQEVQSLRRMLPPRTPRYSWYGGRGGGAGRYWGNR